MSAARDGRVLDCVVAQKDLATQTTHAWDQPRRGMSFAQAICGHVRSLNGQPLPFGRPLVHQDVEQLMLQPHSFRLSLELRYGAGRKNAIRFQTISDLRVVLGIMFKSKGKYK